MFLQESKVIIPNINFPDFERIYQIFDFIDDVLCAAPAEMMPPEVGRGAIGAGVRAAPGR